jgi:murein DD-endopeptidase MepM/ murein hydrolase activator NlpD
MKFLNLFCSVQAIFAFFVMQITLPAQSDIYPLDTLSTSDQNVKVVLYSDYTWKYYKTPSDSSDTDLFDSNWNCSNPNPYRFSLNSFPDQVSICLVDSAGRYHSPDSPCKVYSGFGYRHGRVHQGVDLPLKYGDPVYAVFDGKVRMSRYYHGYGNLVVIRHTNGLETFYGHLSKRLVSEGDMVCAGQIIGKGGATGRATGVHLHFETRYDGYAFDPQWLIDFSTGNLRENSFVLKKKYLNPKNKYAQDFEDDISLADSSSLQDDCLDNAGMDSSMEKSSSKISYHKIRKGDTLYAIAKNNGTTVSALCNLNGISKKSVLHPGKRIRVQ